MIASPLVALLSLAPVQTQEPWRETLGFRPLFDGQSLYGWHPLGRPDAPVEGWQVQDGALVHPAGAGGGDLVSDATFEDFELEFEWRVAPGANSGVKVRFLDDAATGGALGPEYQVLDDAEHADGSRGETSAAALYGLVAPAPDKPLRPAGDWNTGRVIVRGERIEHWLNGVRVLATEVGGADWERARAASKFAAVEDFGRHVPSPIALQDHGDEVAFRNLLVRRLEPLGEDAVSLFDGRTTAGWRLVGKGEMRVEDGELVGIGGEGKGFLVCDLAPADFVLELELRNDSPANSGVQVRSRIDGERVVGTQIEVDPSERAWSGGLYEEPKAWIASLEHDPIARTAFRPGEWNHYRVECAGPVIRAWVNGILTCDYRTARPDAGVIAFQLHDPGTRMRWRGVRMRIAPPRGGWFKQCTLRVPEPPMVASVDIATGDRRLSVDWSARIDGEIVRQHDRIPLDVWPTAACAISPDTVLVAGRTPTTGETVLVRVTLLLPSWPVPPGRAPVVAEEVVWRGATPSIKVLEVLPGRPDSALLVRIDGSVAIVDHARGTVEELYAAGLYPKLALRSMELAGSAEHAEWGYVISVTCDTAASRDGGVVFKDVDRDGTIDEVLELEEGDWIGGETFVRFF